MAHAEEIVILDRPIAEVFAFLAYGLNEPKWRPEVSDVRLASTSSTSVTFTLDLTPKGLMVLMTRMINKQVASEAATILNLPTAIAG
jgi:hypothetical protein